MSFILEALKKSEQQRLQNNTSQQEVCKRTLSLSSRRSISWFSWLVAGFLSLFLIGGWWFYSGIESASLAPSPSVNGASHAPSSLDQPISSEPTPVAHDSVSAPAKQPEAVSNAAAPAISTQNRAPAASPFRNHDIMPRKNMGSAEPVTTVVGEQPEAQIRENLPLYLDLPKELRDRIPRLAMSMHYHSSDPGRRLLRINDRLLHEGDWLSSELHVVEITPTGAILDFQGTSFVMRSPIR